jgi:hypothetical protein
VGPYARHLAVTARRPGYAASIALVAIRRGLTAAGALGVLALALPAPGGGVPVEASRTAVRTSVLERPLAGRAGIVADSAAIVRRSILPFVGTANLAGSDTWGISVVRAGPGDPMRVVRLFSWGYGSPHRIAFRIPDWAQPSTGSDHHLAVIDGDSELDLWGAVRQADGSWRAGSRTIVSGTPVAGKEGATASGLALTAGLLRPEEIAQGRIDHALAFTTPYVRNRVVPPAVKGDGRQRDPLAMPMGTHIQLDPNTDITRLPRPERIIARALKVYGAYLVDTGGSLAIRAEAGIGRARTGTRDIWSPVGMASPSLRDIPWDHMRVVDSPDAR